MNSTISPSSPPSPSSSSSSSSPIVMLHPSPLVSFMSDKQLSLFVPFMIYWIYSGFYYFISIFKISIFEKYKIHSSIEIDTKNKVTIGEVIKGVLLQQFFQTLFGLLIIVVDDEDALVDDTLEILKYQKSLDLFVDKFESLKFAIKPFGNIIIELLYWYLFPLLRFAFAMILLDTWQYFMHRYFHQNTFLYRHIHSLHHKLYAPYAFGALYNHPIEGFIMDTVGAGLSFKISGLSTRGGMLFFGFATFKTGYRAKLSTNYIYSTSTRDTIGLIPRSLI